MFDSRLLNITKSYIKAILFYTFDKSSGTHLIPKQFEFVFANTFLVMVFHLKSLFKCISVGTVMSTLILSCLKRRQHNYKSRDP